MVENSEVKQNELKYGVFLLNFCRNLGQNDVILPRLAHRLYRWPTDNNRPINRPNFDRLIGRLIGIGRTLLQMNFLF